jgi:hypothetical protein
MQEAPGAQLRADAAAQLGMSQIQVVATLGDVIGELVADRESSRLGQPSGPMTYNPTTSGSSPKSGAKRGRRSACHTDDNVAIALAEPLRLHAGLTVGRAAPRTPLEHPHRIRECLLVSRLRLSFRCMASRAEALPDESGRYQTRQCAGSGWVSGGNNLPESSSIGYDTSLHDRTARQVLEVTPFAIAAKPARKSTIGLPLRGMPPSSIRPAHVRPASSRNWISRIGCRIAPEYNFGLVILH